MARSDKPEPKRDQPSTARRVAGATGRVLWGTVKVAGRVLWWTGKTGYRVGKRVAESRERRKGRNAQAERPRRP